MTELDHAFDRVKERIRKAHALQGLDTHEGWLVIREELDKMLESIRIQAVSKDSLDPVIHATYVGAHNALSSLLKMVDNTKESLESSKQQLEELENHEREARLGIHAKL